MLTFYYSRCELNKCLLLSHFDYLKKFCPISPVPTKGDFNGRIYVKYLRGRGKEPSASCFSLKQNC